jgi:hypothetical protein
MTYLNQHGRFVEQLTGETTNDKDSFFVTDVALGYRLPRRLGVASLEIRNLFDEEFKFQDSEPGNVGNSRDRSIFGRLTLTF